MVALEKYMTEPFDRPADYRSSGALSVYEPVWQAQVEQRIAELKLLKEGWDGAAAKPVDRHVAGYALELLESLCAWDTKPPAIVPMFNGGLQIEWHTNGVDVEISIARPYEAELFIEYLEDDQEIERPLQADDQELAAALHLISA